MHNVHGICWDTSQNRKPFCLSLAIRNSGKVAKTSQNRNSLTLISFWPMRMGDKMEKRRQYQSHDSSLRLEATWLTGLTFWPEPCSYRSSSENVQRSFFGQAGFPPQHVEELLKTIDAMKVCPLFYKKNEGLGWPSAVLLRQIFDIWMEAAIACCAFSLTGWPKP